MTENRYPIIIWASLKETFAGKLRAWFLGGVGSPIAVLLIGKNFFNLEPAASVIIGLKIFGCIFGAVFLLYLCRNLLRHFHFLYKESNYGEAIILLKESFSRIHAIRKKSTIDDAEFMAAMIVFCNNLKAIFDTTTRSVSSVSIKVPLSGPIHEAALVTNLCRDTEHSKIRDTDLYKNTKHSIIGNTPFQRIFNNIIKGNKKGFHYLNQNINISSDYENTSKDVYPNGELPYKSELVYPIIPQIKNETGNYDCLGFICIDCKKANAFDEKYDIAIVEGVADGVYDLIFARNMQKALKTTKPRIKDEQLIWK